MKIDLHMHSNHSLDGDFSVQSLAKQCDEAGLNVVALADHNTTKGVLDFTEEARKYDMKVISAVEIDCVYEQTNLHVLAYNIDPKNETFNKLGENIIRQEQEIAEKRIKLIQDLGIYINREKLDAITINGVVTGEMIAEASLYEVENEGNELLAPFLDGGSQSDNPFVNFYWEFCGQGKVAYIETTVPSLDEILLLIKESNGVSVLAHPGHNVFEDEKLLDGIMESGVRGIEVYSSYHTEAQKDFYHDYALKHDYLITAGSDYHGKIKPSIHLGKLEIPQEYIDAMINELL